MANMTCKLLWKKPISLSRAAKLMSRFAALNSGATAAISTYVQRSADAFTHLAHFHSKSSAKPPTADSADQSALTIVNAVAGEAAEPKEKKKKRKRSMNDAMMSNPTEFKREEISILRGRTSDVSKFATCF